MMPSSITTYTKDPHADADAAADQLFNDLMDIVRRNYNVAYLRWLIRSALSFERALTK